MHYMCLTCVFMWDDHEPNRLRGSCVCVLLFLLAFWLQMLSSIVKLPVESATLLSQWKKEGAQNRALCLFFFFFYSSLLSDHQWEKELYSRIQVSLASRTGQKFPSFSIWGLHGGFCRSRLNLPLWNFFGKDIFLYNSPACFGDFLLGMHTRNSFFCQSVVIQMYKLWNPSCSVLQKIFFRESLFMKVNNNWLILLHLILLLYDQRVQVCNLKQVDRILSLKVIQEFCLKLLVLSKTDQFECLPVRLLKVCLVICHVSQISPFCESMRFVATSIGAVYRTFLQS